MGASNVVAGRPEGLGIVAAGDGRGTHAGAHIGREAAPGEKGIRSLAPFAQVGLSCERGRPARDQATCSELVGKLDLLVVRLGAAITTGPRSGDHTMAPGQDGSDDLAVDTLERQLASQGSLAPGPSAVATLDPGTREDIVVEIAIGEQSIDDDLDGRRGVAQMPKPTTGLVHRPRSDGEEGGRGLKDNGRILDLGALCPARVRTGATLGEGRPAAGHRASVRAVTRPR